MRILTIAAIQTAPVPQDTAATWTKFEEQARNTMALFPHVDLLVAPELLLTAPDRLLASDPDYEARAAEPVPGPISDKLSALARDLHVWMVPGSLIEAADDGHLYNTAIAIDPEGHIVARYRKMFPWTPYETTKAGSEFVTFDIPDIGRMGLAICYDGSFPEVSRQLAWLGADVIIQPTLTTTRDRDMELVMSRANGFTNQVFVVNLNTADPVGVGISAIVDPEGTVMQQAGPGEEILIGVLDLDRVTTARQFGSHGLNRPWNQLAHMPETPFPMFGGASPVAPDWLAHNEDPAGPR
ncbi:MAG: hydrolase [Frondihabitans sp.]|nr:hydrolase [Frondihabitans sp.]